MSIRSFLRTFVMLSLAVTPLLAGCGKKSSKVTQPASTPGTAVITTFIVGGVPGTFDPSALPVGTAAPPAVAASDSFVAGTNALLVVTVPDSTMFLFLGISGHTGYFHVPIPSQQQMAANAASSKRSPLRVLSARPSGSVGMLELVVTVGVMPGQTTVPLVFVAEGPHSRTQAAAHTFHASNRAAGSGQLQFSLSWSAPVDLDLHVQVPVGSDSLDIFYGMPSDGGGSLDLDSNAGCGIDNIDNENITWGANVPAHGTYKVRVDLWSACEATAVIPYVVTIRQCGVIVQTIQGVASPGEADMGGSFSGRLVGTTLFNGCAGAAQPVPTMASSAASATPWQRGLKLLGVR